MQAGYKYDGSKLVDSNGKQLSIDLLGNSTGQFSGPQLMASQLGAVGIAVNLRSVPTTAFTADYVQGNFDLAISSLVGATPAPTISYARNFLDVLPPVGANYIRVQDDTLKNLGTAAQSATLDKRCALWKRVLERFNKQNYALPLGVPTSYWFSTGFDYVTNGGAAFEPWSLAKRK